MKYLSKLTLSQSDLNQLLFTLVPDDQGLSECSETRVGSASIFAYILHSQQTVSGECFGRCVTGKAGRSESSPDQCFMAEKL